MCQCVAENPRHRDPVDHCLQRTAVVHAVVQIPVHARRPGETRSATHSGPLDHLKNNNNNVFKKGRKGPDRSLGPDDAAAAPPRLVRSPDRFLETYFEWSTGPQILRDRVFPPFFGWTSVDHPLRIQPAAVGNGPAFHMPGVGLNTTVSVCCCRSRLWTGVFGTGPLWGPLRPPPGCGSGVITT